MSGETLTSAQPGTSPGPSVRPGAPWTAIEDCVRGFARLEPERTPAQFRQLQFHCGNPPPAAAPSTLIFIYPACRGGDNYRRRPLARDDAIRSQNDVRSAIADVHRDFHAEPHVNRCRGFPLHDLSPQDGWNESNRRSHHRHPRSASIADDHETGLMIFMSLPPTARRAPRTAPGSSGS